MLRVRRLRTQRVQNSAASSMADSPLAAFARESRSGISSQMDEHHGGIGALKRSELTHTYAGRHVEGRLAKLPSDEGRVKRIPVLPCDCLRMIYARKWRLEAQGRAVCVIQRAVRRAIIRAQGDPWDLPPLVDSDALYSLCFGTLVQCRV